MLERESPEPLYQQIATYFEGKIAAGELKVGDRLGSEDDIAAQFNVSRITVRQAIGALVDKSLLVRKQGKGTFVTGNPVRHDLERHELLGSLLAHDPTASAKLVCFNREPATEQAAAIFGILPGKPLTRFGRTYQVRERLVAYLEAWLVPDVCDLPRNVAETLSTEQMLRKCKIEIKDFSLAIGAQPCSADLAERLGIKQGDAILTMQRSRFGRDKLIKEYATAFFRADSYEFFLSKSVGTPFSDLVIKNLAD